MLKRAAGAMVIVLGVSLGCGGAEPSVSMPQRTTDENGVVIGGGETSDFGAGVMVRGCGLRENVELPVEVARDQGIARIDAHLALLDREFEAPFHHGYCDGDCPEGTSLSTDTKVRLSARALTVYRIVREPLPETPDAICEDLLAYRAVIDLSTDDGRLSGRFYARLSASLGPGTALFAENLRPDVRNFSGSLRIPVDLTRPHSSAVHVSINLDESSFRGGFQLAIHYTDAGELRRPHLGDDRLILMSNGPSYPPVGGLWPTVIGPYRASYSRPREEFSEVGTELVALSEYTGSQIPPTCLVNLSAYDGSFSTALTTTLLVNGVPVELRSPLPVPYVLGRFEEGTLIELEVSGTEPSVGAGIEVPPFRVLNHCEEEGCVAGAEYRVTGYCSL